jgi:hypothetical protein
MNEKYGRNWSSLSDLLQEGCTDITDNFHHLCPRRIEKLKVVLIIKYICLLL